MCRFRYQNKCRAYIAEIGNIFFCCEEVEAGYEQRAAKLAEAYSTKIYQVVSFVFDDVRSICGELSARELMNKLGPPLIDLDREVIVYFRHALDNEHIIEVEFGGILEKFYSVTVDG